VEWKGVKIQFSDRKWYKINISCIHQGVSLWKFEVAGGNKKAILDKHLYRKSNKWMQPVGGLNEIDVVYLGKVIDFLIENPTGEKPKYVHPKNIG
jgi:hypothetical protein